ncbi:hypothetical protein HDU96_003327 [Phlyctochytrium bullatum]|nr:hypothetical protein HDU96_003327 [Phlyctochytrium bullatum]
MASPAVLEEVVVPSSIDTSDNHVIDATTSSSDAPLAPAATIPPIEDAQPVATSSASSSDSSSSIAPVTAAANVVDADAPAVAAPAKERAIINPSFLSWLFLAWIEPIIWLGFKKPLEIQDLPLLNPRDQTNTLAILLEPFWQKVKEHLASPKTVQPPSLLRFLVGRFFLSWLLSGICLGLSVGSQVAVPTFIQQVIYYLQPTYPRENLYIQSGVGIAFVIFFLQLSFTLFGQTNQQINRTVLVNVRTILISAIYEKSLRLSNEASQKFTQGYILNLINVDAETIAIFILSSHTVVVTPIQVIVTLYLLHKLLGNAVFAALGALLSSLVVQAILFSFIGGVQKRLLKESDSRLKLIRELLYSIRVVKFRAWEGIFENRVGNLRTRQLKALGSFNIILVLFVCLAQLTPILMPIVAFIAYARNTPGGLDPAVIFPGLALFQLLIGPMFILPTVFSELVRSIVSWNRIRAFLRATESEPIHFAEPTAAAADAADAKKTGDIPAVTIVNGTFRWERAKVADGDKVSKDSKDGKDKADAGAVTVEDAADSGEKPAKKRSGWGSSRKKPATTPEDELPPPEPFFKDLSLNLPAGKLVCVVGPVGAGKSSLLNAMIGEMTRLEGAVTFHGRIAYVPQQPWILTDTVEGNIVFGNASGGVDRERLERAVKVASLGPDLERLPAGIRTQIGEKGVNISGGQKARVSLARAVYDDADIYLLDDPISALDAHVGQRVFEDCILTALSGKTRVLVTHQLHLLPKADVIVVMETGRVAEIGAYDELVAREGSLLSVLMKDYSQQNATDDGDKPKAGKEKEAKKEEKAETKKDANDEDDEKLMAEEDRSKGALKKEVWMSFFRAAGGWPMVIAVVVAALTQQTLGLITSLWLAWWSSDKFGFSQDRYLTFYGALGGSQAIAMICLNALVVGAGFLASVHYHKAAMKRLLRAPISFFESQPIGRVLNRFSKDIEAVDQKIWVFYFFVIFSGGNLLATFSLIGYVAPFLMFLLVPLIAVYCGILIFYRRSVIEIKRLDSNERSPLYAHISETLSGVPSVRAFRREESFIKKQRRLLDLSNSPSYMYSCTAIWVSIRIEFIASLIIMALALLGVTSAVNPALIGLSLSYALGVVEDIGFLLKALANLESEMNAVERLENYATALPQEAPDTLAGDPKEAEWPSAGRIEIKNLEVRYPSRPTHPVLKDLTLEIKPGEKVGVVGRTGSGKSTLLTTMFRLVEPHSGTIEIDGVDISRLGLSALRSRIGVITQEPVLFSGTIRSNLDVENKHSDTELWEVLEMIGLKTYVSSLPFKLEDPISENGENLSVGQRQLVCLGRAILYRSRILLLDEATASVDQAADNLIQESIRTHFKQATVVSVAHRLNTVVALDRVLVLEDGKLVEFDSPAKLLSTEGSAFRRLAEVTDKDETSSRDFCLSDSDIFSIFILTSSLLEAALRLSSGESYPPLCDGGALA